MTRFHCTMYDCQESNSCVWISKWSHFPMCSNNSELLATLKTHIFYYARDLSSFHFNFKYQPTPLHKPKILKIKFSTQTVITWKFFFFWTFQNTLQQKIYRTAEMQRMAKLLVLSVYILGIQILHTPSTILQFYVN